MSRCFPFPPPGYDKKIPFDAEAWLKKERREKKHKKKKREREDNEKKDKKEKKRDKKEKRDKEDQKRKHKKDKERSEDGQREKKDSTEVKDNDKHRETEVHKTSVENDKHREIERNQMSAEKDTFGPVKYNSFKNIGSNCAQRKDTRESPLVQKINLAGRGNPEESATVLEDKRDTDGKVYGQGNEFVARSRNSCSLLSNIGGDERKVALVPGLADKRTTEQKENGMHKNVDGKKDGHKDPYREKKCKPKGEIWQDRENVRVPDAQQLQTKENNRNAVCFDNGKPSLLSKAVSKTSNLGKRKALEMNDVLLHEKESQPNKLSRFHPPSDHVSEGGRNLEPCTTPSQPISKFAEEVQNHNVSSKFSYNGSKLEETQANIQLVSKRQENRDSYDANDNVILSHPIVQNDVPVVRNGTVVDEAVTYLSSGGDVVIDDQKVNHNNLKINGLEEGKKTNVSSPRPSSKKVKKDGGIAAKPPHPDSKYLSQILSIPSVELPDVDNQEWLFSGSHNRQSDKPTSGSSQVAEPKHVWSKAVLIESADIIALPYVIPY